MASAWPPLELASGTPVAPSGLSGTLAVITRSDGKRQVTYNNQPLYYFSLDIMSNKKTAASGDLLKTFRSTWHIVTP